MDEQGAGTHGDNGMTETAGFTPAEIDAAMALHEGLVRKVAGQYLGGWGRKADDDLLQEGRFGLWQGLRRYDRNRGTEVSTCVVPWIRKYILAELGRRGKYGATFVASLQDPVGEDGETTRGEPAPRGAVEPRVRPERRRARPQRASRGRVPAPAPQRRHPGRLRCAGNVHDDAAARAAAFFFPRRDTRG